MIRLDPHTALVHNPATDSWTERLLPLSERLTTDLRGVNGLADVLVDWVVGA